MSKNDNGNVEMSDTFGFGDVVNHPLQKTDSLSLVELAISAISKRPNYRAAFVESARKAHILQYDSEGKPVLNKKGEHDTKEDYVYSEALRVTTMSNVVVKAIVSALNDRQTNSIYVPSLCGKMCVFKEVTNEEDTDFIRALPSSPAIFSEGVESGVKYTFINFNLKDGKLTKEQLTGIQGYKLGSLIHDTIGFDRFYHMVLNSSNVVSTLSEELVKFIKEYEPEDFGVIDVLDNLKASKYGDKRFDNAISYVAKQIKVDAKAAKVISIGESRSKNLVTLIEFKLKELYSPKAKKEDKQ